MTRALVKLQTRVHRLRTEDGATAVEYGLMIALIAMAIMVTVAVLGGKLGGVFGEVAALV